jgi:hypothetical protein
MRVTLPYAAATRPSALPMYARYCRGRSVRKNGSAAPILLACAGAVSIATPPNSTAMAMAALQTHVVSLQL